jgi:hypothetical protein
MNAYRYLPTTYPPGSRYPILPFESIVDAYNLDNIPSLDDIEMIWNQQQYLPFVTRYNNGNIYYFIMPINTYLPDISLYRRLDFSRYALYDDRDRSCDIAVKPILLDIMRRFEKRFLTHSFIKKIRQSILEGPDEIEHHTQLVHILSECNTDQCYDAELIKSVLHESNTILETERRFRPGGDGFEEAYEDFKKVLYMVHKN